MRFPVLALLALVPAQVAWSEIRLGVVAPQGPDAAIAAWQPFADYLGSELGEEITMFALGPVEGTEAFYNGHIDVLVGNPVQTAVVTDTMEAVPIASVARSNGTQFAGLIVVRQDAPIQTLEDLRGRRIATLGDWAAGGFLFQAHHLVEANIGRPRDIGDRIVGKNQNELIEMVMDGRADAAFVRTGVVEEREASGKIAEDALRVLDLQPKNDGDFARTTRWFPSWFVSAQNWLEEARLSRLYEALAGVSPDMPEAEAAGIVGFTPPLEIESVVAAMRTVGVAPYD